MTAFRSYLARLYVAVPVMVGGVAVFGVLSWAGLITTTQSLEPAQIAWGGDHAYVYTLKLPALVRSGLFTVDSDDAGGDVQKTLASRLALYEDGRRLGPPHSLESAIRRKGGGGFSHCQFGRGLIFSTSDNSDPHGNGRHYRVRYPIKLAPDLTLDALVAFSLLAVLWVERRWRLAGRVWTHLKRAEAAGHTAPAKAAILSIILAYAALQLVYRLVLGLE